MLVAALSILALASCAASNSTAQLTYAIVGTGVVTCYDIAGAPVTPCPQMGAGSWEGNVASGQDAQLESRPASYWASRPSGTVRDHVTGLTWTASADTDGDGLVLAADKMTYPQAKAAALRLRVAGFADWRLPSVKELYSLADFGLGVDPSGAAFSSLAQLSPFINRRYFTVAYGDLSAGEAATDAEFITSTLSPRGDLIYGVNFATGRVLGYGRDSPMKHRFYVLFVRDGKMYGKNRFRDNGDTTVTDAATGLMWAQSDSGKGYDWDGALEYAYECNMARHLGYRDWRVPTAKELHSIVDYTRSPDTSGSASIDPVFESTSFVNELGQIDWPYYWSGTTETVLAMDKALYAAYWSFGRSLQYVEGEWVDLHGSGTQRSDLKAGNASNYPAGRPSVGDAVRIKNFVRLVRTAVNEVSENSDHDGLGVRPFGISVAALAFLALVTL